jgi:hypothetical protein
VNKNVGLLSTITLLKKKDVIIGGFVFQNVTLQVEIF